MDTLGRQHGPPVNKRDLSTGENGELDSETLASNTDPGGSCWTPGNPSLQLSKPQPPSTREMLGITATRGSAAVNENSQTIQGRGTVAPRHGFEPRFTAPKAAVLPLDDRGMRGKMLTPTSLALPVQPPQRALLQSSRKPILAGAGCGLQTRCAALVSRVGSTPTGFRHFRFVSPTNVCVRLLTETALGSGAFSALGAYPKI